MIPWLESLPTLSAGIVVVGGFVLLALLIGYLASRFTSREVRTAHNDRAGFILAVIGVIYAVLLAFVAIGVWERFQQAEARSYEEAASIATVYRDAGSFPSATRLRATLRAYVFSVIHHEWPQMSRGERSQVSNALLETADRDVQRLPANGPRLADIQTQMLVAMDTALMDREERLTVDSSGINRIMWFVLIVGAIVTVAFTYLFGFDQTLMQELMIGGLSFLIGLVLFLIIALDYPFRGSIAVSPEAFKQLIDTFNAIGR
jgi:multisubunit Na+/H+ antiporter MnhB subunit